MCTYVRVRIQLSHQARYYRRASREEVGSDTYDRSLQSWGYPDACCEQWRSLPASARFNVLSHVPEALPLDAQGIDNKRAERDAGRTFTSTLPKSPSLLRKTTGPCTHECGCFAALTRTNTSEQPCKPASAADLYVTACAEWEAEKTLFIYV